MKLSVGISGSAGSIALASLIALRAALPASVVGTTLGFALAMTWAFFFCVAAALHLNAPVGGVKAWNAFLAISTLLLGIATTVVLNLGYFALPDDTGVAAIAGMFYLVVGCVTAVGWVRLFKNRGDTR